MCEAGSEVFSEIGNWEVDGEERGTQPREEEGMPVSLINQLWDEKSPTVDQTTDTAGCERDE